MLLLSLGDSTTYLFKVAFAVIGNVPAQHMVADLVVFVPLVFPFLGREPRKGRQIEVLRFYKSYVFLEYGVYLGAFHVIIPFKNEYCQRLNRLIYGLLSRSSESVVGDSCPGNTA